MAEESKVKKISKKAKAAYETLSTLRKYRTDPSYEREVEKYGKKAAEKNVRRAAALSAIETKAYTSTNIFERVKARSYLAVERGIASQFGTVGEIYRQSRRAPTKELAKQIRSDTYKRIFANTLGGKFGMIGEVFATKIRSTIGTSFGEDPDKTFTQIKQNFFSIADEFKHINENFQKTDRKIEVITKRIDGTNRTIREDIRILQDAVGVDPKSKNKIIASIEKVESAATENESTIRNVETKLGIEINRINTVESRISSMQSDIERLFILVQKKGPGDNEPGASSSGGLFNMISRAGGAAAAGVAGGSIGGRILHSIVPMLGLAASVTPLGRMAGLLGTVGSKLLPKIGGAALGGAAAYGAYKYMGGGAMAEGMNLGALSGAIPGMAGMGDVTGKMMNSTGDLTKQMAGVMGAGGIGATGIKHMFGLPDDEESTTETTDTTKKQTGADKLKKITDAQDVQNPLDWLKNKIMGGEKTPKPEQKAEAKPEQKQGWFGMGGFPKGKEQSDTQAQIERARIEQEKSRFMAFGTLPAGFEYLEGHMGRLGQPGAVAAAGAMPLGGGAGFGGSSGGYGFASGGGGYGYSPPSGPGSAGSRSSGYSSPAGSASSGFKGGTVDPGSATSGTYDKQVYVDPKHGVASVRYNNPGAAYPSKIDEKYGLEGYGIIGGGHKIGKFPTVVHGAAANFALWDRKYVGKTLQEAVNMWRGGNGSLKVPDGFEANMRLTREQLNDREFMTRLFKGMAKHEAGRQTAITDEQWAQAYDMYKAGGVEEYKKLNPNFQPTPLEKKDDPRTTQSVSDGSSKVIEAQTQLAKIRQLPIDPKLKKILEHASSQTGVYSEIYSGGQAGIGTGGPRTGSTRHDHGGAADLKLYVMEDGKKRYLDFNNPNDRPFFQKYVEIAAASGATGIGAGAGYMGTQSIHVGFGSEATWGGADWLGGSFAKGREAARAGYKIPEPKAPGIASSLEKPFSTKEIEQFAKAGGKIVDLNPDQQGYADSLVAAKKMGLGTSIYDEGPGGGRAWPGDQNSPKWQDRLINKAINAAKQGVGHIHIDNLSAMNADQLNALVKRINKETNGAVKVLPKNNLATFYEMLKKYPETRGMISDNALAEGWKDPKEIEAAKKLQKEFGIDSQFVGWTKNDGKGSGGMTAADAAALQAQGVSVSRIEGPEEPKNGQGGFKTYGEGAQQAVNTNNVMGIDAISNQASAQKTANSNKYIANIGASQDPTDAENAAMAYHVQNQKIEDERSRLMALSRGTTSQQDPDAVAVPETPITPPVPSDVPGTNPSAAPPQGPGDAPLPGEEPEKKSTPQVIDRSGPGQSAAQPTLRHGPETRPAEPGSGGMGNLGRCFV